MITSPEHVLCFCGMGTKVGLFLVATETLKTKTNIHKTLSVCCLNMDEILPQHKLSQITNTVLSSMFRNSLSVAVAVNLYVHVVVLESAHGEVLNNFYSYLRIIPNR